MDMPENIMVMPKNHGAKTVDISFLIVYTDSIRSYESINSKNTFTGGSHVRTKTSYY